MEAYLRDVQIVYEWSVSKNFILENSISNLAGFSQKKLESLAKALCSSRTGDPARQATCIRRKQSISLYLTFALNFFIGNRRLSLTEQAQAQKNATAIVSRLKKHMNKASNDSAAFRPSTDLTDSEIGVIEMIFDPASLHNPFEEISIRWRNYCMFKIFLATLARRSEIVLLEIDDIDCGPTPTIKIKLPSNANKGKRKDGASLKTRTREVPITHELAKQIHTYITTYRSKFLPAKLASTSLFLSHKDGRRLFSNSLNSIMKKVEIKAQSLGFNNRLHPHGLRTTAANQLRTKLLKDANVSKIEAEEIISYMGGWAEGSEQVRKYTRRTMSEILGKLLRAERN